MKIGDTFDYLGQKCRIDKINSDGVFFTIVATGRQSRIDLRFAERLLNEQPTAR